MNIDVNDFKRLVHDVEMIKSILLCHKPGPDPDGELSDWAKRELEEARKIPDSENITLEEMEQRILAK